jgi:type II secretory pathway component HofQ
MRSLISGFIILLMLSCALPVNAATSAVVGRVRSTSAERNANDPVISMEFVHADTVSVVRMLAHEMHLNLVVDSSVHGEVTIALKNVRAHQALKLLMATNGLQYDEFHGLLVVGPKSAIDRLSDASGHRQVFIGQTRILEIPLQYAKSAAIADTIKGFYPQLDVQVGCNNSVVVRGPSDQVLYVRKLIKGY